MKHANIALFVPHSGCPHQCSFCNQRSITGKQCQPGPADVEQAVQTALRHGAAPSLTEIAFFGGSFTAIERETMISLLRAAFPLVKEYGFLGVRVSTRPDAISPEILALLKAYNVTAVELGAQSMDDEVLFQNGRGHNACQVEQAAALIREAGLSLGLQMMTGLPGSTPQKDWQTAERLLALLPDTMRIYPTQVVKGTPLAELWRRGEYAPPDLPETVELCAGLLDLFFGNGVRVIRLGLHDTPELEQDRLAGPWHPAFGELCYGRLFLLRLLRALREAGVSSGEITVSVHPGDFSKALGQHRSNVQALQKQGYRPAFVPLTNLPRGRFQFSAQGGPPSDEYAAGWR